MTLLKPLFFLMAKGCELIASTNLGLVQAATISSTSSIGPTVRLVTLGRQPKITSQRLLLVQASVSRRLGLAIPWFLMMKRETITIADIYVPTKRRGTLEQKRVDEIAASILDKGLQAPILVRADGARFVLVEGLHRLEAAKALGEQTIVAFLVDARKH